MELAVLRKVAFELNTLLAGAFVSKIHQPLPREIVLRLRSWDPGEKKLVLSADPKLGRVHLTELKIPNPPAPPRFCAFLRAHFQGSRILGVKCAEDDRMLRIAAVRGPAEGRVQRDLVLELLGRDSNILLIDGATNRIMDCLHHIPRKEQGSRVVLPGGEYLPPPRGAQPRHVPPGELQLLESRPGVRKSPNGKRVVVLDADPEKDESFATANEAVEAVFSATLKTDLLEALRRDLKAPLKARVRALERRIGKIQADSQRLESLAERLEEGELLKGNLKRIRKGMDRIEVQDWNTGRPRIIMLDPALDAVANMERIFTRAAKGKRGEKKVQQRMEQTLSEKQAVEDQLYFVEHAENMEELEGLALEGSRPEAVHSPGPREKKKDTASRASMFHQFACPSGRPVLVGKSAGGNDFLLRRKAKASDLWFHIKGAAGSHVLLPQRGSETASAADVRYAAGLAVHFSKVRGSGKAEVIMAVVKDLHKPKGALPGQVAVRRYTSVVGSSSEVNFTA